VASRAPDDQKAMRALATGHYKLADVQASTGQTAPGIESFRSSLALAERMADSSLRHRGYLRLGDIPISDGNLERLPTPLGAGPSDVPLRGGTGGAVRLAE
jgi:hypothetical protein